MVKEVTQRTGGTLGLSEKDVGSQRRDQARTFTLYLAEYVWRYNHRGIETSDQNKIILSLIQAKYNSGG
jgi:hypothetical protein